MDHIWDLARATLTYLKTVRILIKLGGDVHWWPKQSWWAFETSISKTMAVRAFSKSEFWQFCGWQNVLAAISSVFKLFWRSKAYVQPPVTSSIFPSLEQCQNQPPSGESILQIRDIGQSWVNPVGRSSPYLWNPWTKSDFLLGKVGQNLISEISWKANKFVRSLVNNCADHKSTAV